MVYMVFLILAFLAFMGYLSKNRTETLISDSKAASVGSNSLQGAEQGAESISQKRRIVLGLDIGGVVNDNRPMLDDSEEERYDKEASNIYHRKMVLHPKIVKSAKMLASIKEHSNVTLVFQSADSSEDQQRIWNRYMEHVLRYNQESSGFFSRLFSRRQNCNRAGIPELPRVRLITVPTPYEINGSPTTDEQVQDLVKGTNFYGCPQSVLLDHVNGIKKEKYEVEIRYYPQKGNKADAHEIVKSEYKVDPSDFYYLDDGEPNIERAKKLGYQAIHINEECCMADALEERINQSLLPQNGDTQDLSEARRPASASIILKIVKSS